MNARRWRIALLVLPLLLSAAPVAALSTAGVSTAAAAIDAEGLAAFAKKVEREAAQRGARVIIVARIGRDPASLPPGIEYTHTAIGIYSSIPLADGRNVPGYVFHNLYQRADKGYRSSLVVDTAFDFFIGVHTRRAAMIVPIPEVQRRLLATVESGAFERLHNPRYSAISNPMNDMYQNCVEHLLDALNAAIYQSEDVRVLKARAREWFEPQAVVVDAGRLRLASLFAPDIALADHTGTVATATYGSLLRYMQRFSMVEEVLLIEP